MKSPVLFITSVFCLAIATSACKKESTTCSDEAEFCGFVNANNINATRTPINKFLASQNAQLSSDAKLASLRDWLKCKSCVEDASVLCNSCIWTGIPQSELKVIFKNNGVLKNNVLDILMDDTLKFFRYHD